MDYGLVIFVTMTCLLMLLTDVLGKPRLFPESTNLTIGEEAAYQDQKCPSGIYLVCPRQRCMIDGKEGDCVAGRITCHCKFDTEENGSKYLPLANEMSTKKLGRTMVENMEQQNDERYPPTLSKKTKD